jgi:WD40 repeat protein
VAFGANGRIAAVGGDGKVWLFDAAVSRELPRHAEGPVNDIAFDPMSARIATAGYDGTVRLADARSGRGIGPPLLGPGAFSSLAFSSRRDEVAAGSDDGRVLVFDLSAGRAAQRHVVGQRTAVRSVAFSPDGTLIASGGYEDDPLIVLSDAESHRPRGRPLAGHAKSVNALAFSPDGRELASASADGTVRRWSIATRRQIGRPFAPHAGEVDDVAFSPDGQTLASAGGDDSIWLQDLRGGSLRRLSSGDDSLASIAFTPDGSMLVAGGARGAALLDVASGRQLGERLTAGSGSPNGFSAVAVSPDGRSFATAEEAGARLRPGIIWPDPRTLSVEICRLVGSGLTRAEWSRYAPGIAYEPMCDA